LPEAQCVAFDVVDAKTYGQALEGVQAVVHLAAVNEIESLADPEKALRVNTLGTLKLLRATVAAGIERFMYFSTAHVYGAPLVGDIEEQTLTRPVHPYAITHHAAEEFVLAAHDEQRLAGIVVRLSNGFGAPAHARVDRWTLLANDLCRQAAQTQQLTLRSSGLQQRDFITLADVGRAVSHLLNLPRITCGNGLFNLGGECSLSVWDMAQRIAKRCQAVLGFLPPIVRPEPRPDETTVPLHYRMDKLKQSGFRLSGNIDVELDDALRLCHQAFGNAR
jgi:UDP-glucose 4-epimerase